MRNENPSLTEAQARAVYAILKEECGALDSYDEDSFIFEFTTDDTDGPTGEWRFCGNLGFGGKFYYPNITVSCYNEDGSPARLAIIERANNRLNELKESFAQHSSPAVK